MPKAGVVIKRIDGENSMWGTPMVRFFIQRPGGEVKQVTERGRFPGIRVGDSVVTSWSLMGGWNIEKVMRVGR